MRETIPLEDDADCETCTRRQAGLLKWLGEVRASVMMNVVCPECGRSVDVWIESEANDD